MLDIKKIIENEEITIKYQPIVSLKQKSLIGLEALSYHITEEKHYNFLDMLSYARSEGLIVALDRVCRKKALENFKKIHISYPDLLLFINFNSEIIDEGVVGSNTLLKSVLGCEINPENIVIEILEANVKNIDDLIKFANTYHSYGFLLAVDDFGKEHSNFDRILHIKPDILKLDRNLIKDCNDDYIKSEMINTLVQFVHKIGGFIVAEGVETQEEFKHSILAGIDMAQGFFIHKPSFIQENDISDLILKIDKLLQTLSKEIIEEKKRITMSKIEKKENIKKFFIELINKLKGNDSYDFNNVLKKIDYSIDFECIYILDSKGTQITDTIFKNNVQKKKNKMFHPATKFTDHSLKNYYLDIDKQGEVFITDPYISIATGNLCRTYSYSFLDKDDEFIICLDILEK